MEKLGYENITVADGRLVMEGNVEDVARLNLWLRTADRVLILMGEFHADTFDELYEGVKKLDWENWIDPMGNFTVEGRSVKSKLFSIKDCQRITERALIDKLKQRDKKEYYEKTGVRYRVEVALLKDIATITLDTSGVGLHKRGYRARAGDAPLKETLAAALVMLSFWRPDRVLFDPFCGSGTIAIEAAMIGRNMAPGLSRDFEAEHWPMIDKKIWKDARVEARSKMDFSTPLTIMGSDIDHRSILRARDNAELIGLEDDITFFIKDMREVDIKDDYGVIITNPPYGERMGEITDLAQLYVDFAGKYLTLPTWSVYVITSYPDFEQLVLKKADRRRKLYNGRIETQYYQYLGPRPPREKDVEEK
ncbi:MAG: class I SAM-dependent RNA methyltransferase [Tissierellia bacterium]|nr:class I SAM-dependent RNA methyltransferase [Tissierellia bacterium]